MLFTYCICIFITYSSYCMRTKRPSSCLHYRPRLISTPDGSTWNLNQNQFIRQSVRSLTFIQISSFSFFDPDSEWAGGRGLGVVLPWYLSDAEASKSNQPPLKVTWIVLIEGVLFLTCNSGKHGIFAHLWNIHLSDLHFLVGPHCILWKTTPISLSSHSKGRGVAAKVGRVCTPCCSACFNKNQEELAGLKVSHLLLYFPLQSLTHSCKSQVAPCACKYRTSSN